MNPTFALIGAAALLALGALPVLVTWLRRPSAPVTVVVSHGAPPVKPQFVGDRPDLRSPEQRLIDQARVNALGFPRYIKPMPMDER